MESKLLNCIQWKDNGVCNGTYHEIIFQADKHK